MYTVELSGVNSAWVATPPNVSRRRPSHLYRYTSFRIGSVITSVVSVRRHRQYLPSHRRVLLSSALFDQRAERHQLNELPI